MDTFQTILELSSTILSIQQFFLVVSEAHEKLGCDNDLCKVGEFLGGLDKILSADKTHDEKHVLFTNYCKKHVNVFVAVYELVLPKNSGKLDEIENLMKNLNDLQKREGNLINELKEIRKQKFSAQKQMKDVIVSIISRE